MILNRATAIRRGPGFVTTRVPSYRIGGHIPRLVPTPVPKEGIERTVSYATLVRRAPETANQAVAGLGVLGADPAPAAPSPFSNLLSTGIQFAQQRQDSRSMTAMAEQQARIAALNAARSQAEQQAALAAGGRAAPKSNLMTYGLIAGGVVAVGLLIFILKRRKSSATP